MLITGDTTDATLCRRAVPAESRSDRYASLAIGTVRWIGEMLLAYPASERRWLYVATPAGELTAPDLEQMRSRDWK